MKVKRLTIRMIRVRSQFQTISIYHLKCWCTFYNKLLRPFPTCNDFYQHKLNWRFSNYERENMVCIYETSIHMSREIGKRLLLVTVRSIVHTLLENKMCSIFLVFFTGTEYLCPKFLICEFRKVLQLYRQNIKILRGQVYAFK